MNRGYKLVVFKGDSHPTEEDLKKNLETYVLSSKLDMNEKYFSFYKAAKGETVNLNSRKLLQEYDFSEFKGITSEFDMRLNLPFHNSRYYSLNKFKCLVFDEVPIGTEVLVLSIVEKEEKGKTSHSYLARYYGKKQSIIWGCLRAYSSLVNRLLRK